jgi:hypothetical protein
MFVVVCLAVLIVIFTSPFVMAVAATETSRTSGNHSDIAAENGTIVAGSTITAEYTITADSRSKFVPVALDLGLPADWQVRTYSAAGSFYRAQSTTWLWLRSDSSAKRTVRVTVYVPRDAKGTYEIDAAVSDGLSVLKRHSSTVTVRQPPDAPSGAPTTDPASPSQIALTTSDVMAAAGSNATVYYTVENTSPTAIHGLTLDLGLPTDDWAVTDHTDDRGEFVAETHSWSWSRIPPNESRTVSATVAVPADASGTYDIGATVAGPNGITFARPSTVTVPGTVQTPGGIATPTPTGPETPAENDAPFDPQPPTSESPFEPGPPDAGGPPMMTRTATHTPTQTRSPTRTPATPGTPPETTTTSSGTTSTETTTIESPSTHSPTRGPTPTTSTPTATRTTAPPQTTGTATQTQRPTTTSPVNTPSETPMLTATPEPNQTSTPEPNETAERTTKVNETPQESVPTTQTASPPGNQSSTTTLTGTPPDSTPTTAQPTTQTTTATGTMTGNPTSASEGESETDGDTEDGSEADADDDSSGWLVNIYPPSAEREESTATPTPTPTATPTPTPTATPTPTRTATPQPVRVSGTAEWIVAMETQPIQSRPSSSFVRFGGNTTGFETVEFTRVHEGTATVRRVVPGTYGSPMDAVAVYDVNVSENSPVERANVTIDLTTLAVDDASTLTFHVRRGDSWDTFEPSHVNRGPGTVTLTVGSLAPIAVTEAPTRNITSTWAPPTTARPTTTDSLQQEQISVQAPPPTPQPATTTTTNSSPIPDLGAELPVVLAVGGLVIALLVHRYRGR